MYQISACTNAFSIEQLGPTHHKSYTINLTLKLSEDEGYGVAAAQWVGVVFGTTGAATSGKQGLGTAPFLSAGWEEEEEEVLDVRVRGVEETKDRERGWGRTLLKTIETF